MIGSTTLGKLFASFLYTQILILSFCFAISTLAPTKPLVLFSPFVLFSVFSSLTHCFHSQMETKRTAIQLFCFLLSFFLYVFCFVLLQGSVSVFLSYVDCSASTVFLIDWCKVEFNQPFCWFYSVPNLLVFQHLVTLYLDGFVVRVVSEIEY